LLVEFADQFVNGFLKVICSGRGNAIGTSDFDSGFGRKGVSVLAILFVAKLYINPNDFGSVAEKLVELLLGETLERFGQEEVISGNI
jgi:hypothetical protein